ncbi:hypothetical protein F3Y22_tig00110365pilonHSYRG00091 [Hibiscus syriacus]|uniref:non-specific serine/threonine protein kinase n=1 Tax=Hibiscus syriacus TaxID=106335 RepID=A0A6A3AUI9_HIBSY|nr:hypothetical protein F3Y22_tig00110365pilonHSYRG00091 [Hibiscus syriacus]
MPLYDLKNALKTCFAVVTHSKGVWESQGALCAVRLVRMCIFFFMFLKDNISGSMSCRSISNNNLSGTLPPELGNLVYLQQLYINSCGLGGQIPSTFANLVNVQIMWASDTALTGKIPDFVGNWTKLTSVRFEGNSFEGPIPSSLANLASLTSLNLEANNFTLTSSNLSKVSCNSTQKWAVSNAGLFADRQNQQYVQNTGAQVRGTNTPQIVQTSRLSPGSLRYYGLDLENGLYTVYLFFAETGFTDRTSQSWTSREVVFLIFFIIRYYFI